MLLARAGVIDRAGFTWLEQSSLFILLAVVALIAIAILFWLKDPNKPKGKVLT